MTSAILVAMGAGVIYGGYQASEQQKSICEQTKNTKKAVEECTKNMNAQIQALKDQDEAILRQIDRNAMMIHSNMYALQRTIQAQASSFMVVRVVMIVSVVLVFILFVLKRRDLLSFNLTGNNAKKITTKQTSGTTSG